MSTTAEPTGEQIQEMFAPIMEKLRANAKAEGRSFDAYDVNPPGTDDTGLWVVSESYAGTAKAWFPTEEQAVKYAQEAALK